MGDRGLDQVLLSIDCGTQSLRAILFSPFGELLAKVKLEYEPYFSSEPGRAEQDPEVFWNSLCGACHDLRQKEPVLFKNIVGIGITSQRNSMVNVDEDKYFSNKVK